MDDHFDLQRFVDAQAGVFEHALAELSAGRKRSHWMWFVFPQLKDLGRSPTARHFGIASMDEARAYLAHPTLGPRLARATEAVLRADAASLNALFGSPDDLKFVSSMTLFSRTFGGDGGIYSQALARWHDGREDAATLELLSLA
ncbi:MAG: DUF1810 domain-containing protein [Phenylobacterium sp.]